MYKSGGPEQARQTADSCFELGGSHVQNKHGHASSSIPPSLPHDVMYMYMYMFVHLHDVMYMTSCTCTCLYMYDVVYMYMFVHV